MLAKYKALWKQAFHDTDEWIDSFFQYVYDPNRCCSILSDGQVLSAVYWMDCKMDGHKLAYLYGLATHEDYRGQGLAGRLLEQFRERLTQLGYHGILLVPANPELIAYYEKRGYHTCTYINEISCQAGTPVALEQLDLKRYAQLRGQYLPQGGVEHSEATLAFLEQYATFWAGDGFVAAVTVENGNTFVHELLGDCPPEQLIAALGAEQGTVRTPGNQKPFAMFLPLQPCPDPKYFGIALD